MRRLALGLAIPLLLLVLWETLGRAGVLSADGFSRPSLIGRALLEAAVSGDLFLQTWQTLSSAALGWALATAAGVAAGALLGLYPPLRRIANLTIETLRPIPSAALIPLSLLLFGFGAQMTVAVVAFACFWPVLVVSVSAVSGVDPRLIEVGRALQLSAVRRIWTLALPAALPSIAVGLRLAFGIAIVVAVTVEIASNPRGLGFGMIDAQQSLRADLMYAKLLWLGVIGWLLNMALVRAERHWLAWFWTAREA